jgi:hypothetical protein
MGEDQGAVRIKDIFLGSLGVLTGRHLLKIVILRENSILGLSPFGDPSAIRNAVPDGKVKGRPVSAGLAAGDDFLDHRSSFSHPFAFRQGRLHLFHLLQEFRFADDALSVQQIDQGFRLDYFGHEEFIEANDFFGVE